MPAALLPVLKVIGPPLIRLVGGSLLSKKSGESGQRAQQQALDQQKRLSDLGIGYAEKVFPYGMDLANRGLGEIQPALDFYRSILSGDRTEAMRTLAPETSRIGEGYNQALQSSRELIPRGGGGSAMRAEIPYRREADISNLISGFRSQAPAQLASIGTNLMNLGQGFTGQGAAYLGGAGSNIGPLLGYAGESRKQTLG